MKIRIVILLLSCLSIGTSACVSDQSGQSVSTPNIVQAPQTSSPTLPLQASPSHTAFSLPSPSAAPTTTPPPSRIAITEENIDSIELLSTVGLGSNSIAFSPDSTELASEGPSLEWHFWETYGWQEVRLLERDRNVVGPNGDWSPDGVYFAHGGVGVTIWDLETRTTLRTLEGHEDLVISLAWSPGGKKLASGSKDWNVRIWNTETGDLIHILSDLSGNVNGVTWSPDGSQLAAVGNENMVAVWDVSNGELLLSLVGTGIEGLNRFQCIAWSPDGRLLAAAGSAGKITIWDTETWAEQAELEGHEGGVLSLAWSPDSALLATAGTDNRVVIWGAKESKILGTLNHNNIVLQVAWSPDGSLLASISAENAGEYFPAVFVWGLPSP